jgi:ATP-dependent helicase HrpA
MAAAQKARRAGLAPGRAELYAFYDRRVPTTACSGGTFMAWWRRQGPAARGALEATPEDLGVPVADSVSAEAFPDAWPAGDGACLPVEYDWDAEGVTIEVPLARLPELGDELAWQVPGLRGELVEALLRSLRKELRRELAPMGERAKKFVAEHGPGDGPLAVVLARSMSEASGAAVRPEDFDWAKVPSYLRPVLQVVGAGGEVLARGKDPAELMEKLRPQFASALAEAASSPALGWGPAGKRAATWDFGTLPKVFEAEWQGQRLRGFPALVDEGQEVRVAVFADEASQRVAMASGARRLLLLALPARRQLVTTLEGLVDNRTRLVLGALGPLAYSSPRELAEDLVVAALDELITQTGGPPSDAQQFAALLEAARRDAEGLARLGLSRALRIISQLQRLRVRTEQLRERCLPPNSGDREARSSAFALALADANAQLAVLGVRRFASRHGLARLPDLERYLTALERRMERLPSDPLRDWRLAEKAQALEHKFDKSLEDARRRGREHEFEDLRWALAELRVSLFAQSLGTKFPVSEARLERALAERRQATGIE